MNKIFLNGEEISDTSHEYDVGQIITMDTGNFPAKCVNKEEVDGSIHYYFTKGEIVPKIIF